MIRLLIFFILILSNFSINAEIKLSCSPKLANCNNCAEHDLIFPLKKFSKNTSGLDIEADESQIIDGNYMLSGSVTVASEKLFLSGDSVEVSSVDDTLVASGQVKYQDDSYLISGDSLSAVQKNDEITVYLESQYY